MDVDEPLPEIVPPPGLVVIVQLDDAGNPLKTTLPVFEEHVVCVVAPITGAAGIAVIDTGAVAVTIPHPPVAAIV
jgi:hypothetical protein